MNYSTKVGGFLLKKAVSFAAATTASVRVPPRATEHQDADVIIVGCGVGGMAYSDDMVMMRN